MDEHDLALHVPALVVVPLGLGIDDAPVALDDRPRHRLLARERHRCELARRDRGAIDRERGLRAALDLGGDRELLLPRTGIAGLHTRGGELVLDVVGRVGEALGADAATFARVIGEPPHGGGVLVGERGLGLVGGLARRALDPRRDEHVRIVLAGGATGDAIGLARAGLDDIAPVRRHRQGLAIRREHREAVEAGGGRDPLEVRAIDVDPEEVELGAAGLQVVRREDHALAAGIEVRRERSARQVRELVRLGAVGVRDPEVHLRRLHEVAREQLLVLIELGALRPRRPPHDLRAIR